MQVSVEQLEGLERRLTVQVPADTISEKIDGRLRTLSRQARIDGFRPGKVPFKVVRRMFGGQVRQEVIGEMLESSLRDALTQENLRPAGGPRIDSLQADEGQQLEYVATFEVFPEFEPVTIAGVKIERPAAEVNDADVDEMLNTLREQRAAWEDVERPSQLRDRVTISFVGKLDGEDFPGNQGDNVPVVLGSSGMLEDFEQQLCNRSAGEQAEFDVTFPDSYPMQQLAGKQVLFNITVHSVAEPQLPEIDTAFAAGFGIEEGSVEKLRQALRENMTRELQEGIKNNVKQQVVTAILTANNISVPKALVDEEVENLAKQSNYQGDEGNEGEGNEGEGNEGEGNEDNEQYAQKQQLFAEPARRRVALGLVVARLVNNHGIEVDDALVQERLETIAASYEDQEAFINWYRQNPNMMEGIRSLVLEDQVIDWLLSEAELVDKPSSFAELMKPQRNLPSDVGDNDE